MTRHIFAGEMYSTICVEWVVDQFGSCFDVEIYLLLTKIFAKNDFTFSFPVTLTFRPQICSPVTLVQHHPLLEISMALLFRENRRRRTIERAAS